MFGVYRRLGFSRHRAWFYLSIGSSIVTPHVVTTTKTVKWISRMLRAVILLAIISMVLIAVLQIHSAAKPDAETTRRVTGRLYVSWDRFELDRCVAAWAISRYLNHGAQFALAPVGTPLEDDGCVTFDVPSADFERTPRLTVTEQVFKHVGATDAVVRHLIDIVRTAEYASWYLDENSEAGRIRDQLLDDWELHSDVSRRFQAIFATLDAYVATRQVGTLPKPIQEP